MPSDCFQQQAVFESNSTSEISKGNVKQFPDIGEDETADANPAIRLFGRRFRDDQTELEYLVEFMLIFVSAKTIGTTNLDGHRNIDAWKGFPHINELKKWPVGDPLVYYPKMHLMLKLFAFLGASGVEGRHRSHLEKHEELVSNLKHHLHANPSISKNEVVDLMEQVLMGFIGVSGNRGWSAHSFLPLAPELIAGEAIWEKSRGRQQPNLNWNQVLKENMFSFSKHDFLARGGELLYLQLCNLFRLTDSPDLLDFENQAGYPGAAKNLQKEVENNLKSFLSRKPAPILNKIASWIENNEGEASLEIARETKGAKCGWCPEESWREAYLFAIELRNISGALLDPMEKIEMLKLCCVFQVLRSLSAQAGRYWKNNPGLRNENALQPYAWIITDPELKDRALKTTARKNLIRVQEMFHAALRTRQIQVLKKGNGANKEKTYRNADKQGTALFVKLGKKIGLIAPKTGPGARFVLKENLLRYLVLALVPPGERMRLTTFLKILYRHYGAVVSGTLLNDAIAWTYPDQNVNPPVDHKKWLEEKLLTTGFMIPLSDAVSLIYNPFSEKSADN
jgi:hypothetical protein